MADVENTQNAIKNTSTRPRRVANPSTLGLFSFASATFILSMYNVQTRGITTPNVVVGMAVFCGGLTQLLAGMWAFCYMNMFAATAFSSFGAFWLSYAMILIPGSGIIAAYADRPAHELSDAIGIYLITWLMVTTLLFFVALHKSVAFIALFACLIITFSLLSAGELLARVVLTRAGGALGIVAACIAYYMGLAELLEAEDRVIVRLPLGVFKRHVD